MKEFLTGLQSMIAVLNHKEEAATGESLEGYEELQEIIEEGIEACEE